MNIAHYLTLFRIFLIPFFPLVYLHPKWFGLKVSIMPYVLFLILVVCEFTDIVDGYFARKKDQVTDLGKIIDPMADAITHISVFFTFTQGIVDIPLLLVFVLLYRELIISALRTLCALKGFALAARRSGKIKAIAQAASCFLVVFLMILKEIGYVSLEFLRGGALLLVSLMAFYSVFTAIDYFYANRKYLKQLID